MELIQMPRMMRERGFTGWPAIYRVSKKEELPPAGIPYINAEETDFALVFRVMVPILKKQHPHFKWTRVYESLTGHKYEPVRVFSNVPTNETNKGHSYGASDMSRQELDLDMLAAEDATYVDLDMLMNMGMAPAFMSDIRQAITMNVTNSFQWIDGFNKKTGMCSGYLEQAPEERSLIILDISGSIPDGISSSMLTLVKTMTEIVSADLIITGGRSEFYTRDEAKDLDIREIRRRINYANESVMFKKILETHDMNYRNVIAFGDSDNPGPIEIKQRLNIETLYDMFCTRYDTYGNSHKHGVGYGRWVTENCPGVTVKQNIEWAQYFEEDL